MKYKIFALTLAASAVAAQVAGEVARNPPPECKAPEGKCACAAGAGVGNACTKLAVDMGATTPWTGAEPCSLKVFADDQSPLVFTPESLSAVCGCAFRRIGNEVLSDGVTPKEVVFSRPSGEPLRFTFAEGESVGRPEPGFGARMDERLEMVDAQGRPTAARTRSARSRRSIPPSRAIVVRARSGPSATRTAGSTSTTIRSRPTSGPRR